MVGAGRMKKNIVVVGAGQAAVSFIGKLRALGFKDPITLIGKESYLPYQRPPLSKKYLSGGMEKERLFIRPAAWYAQKNVTVLLDTEVTKIDCAGQTICTKEGQSYPYSHLVLAVGVRARPLPKDMGAGRKGIFLIRSIQDIEFLRVPFSKKSSIVVIGGGYIGLEVAAVAAQSGHKVSVVEGAARILNRVASAQTSGYFRALHESHKVDFYEGTSLESIDGDRRVSSVCLKNGTVLDADIVLVGIGIIPNTELAEKASIQCDQGILVNEYGETSQKNIYAAGDCTRFYYKNTLIRLENVQNSIDQAENVAKNIMGVDHAYRPVPWFWSDQYDCKLQIAGLNLGYDDVVTRRGDRLQSRSFWYYQGQTLIAVDVVNHPGLFAIAKRLLVMGKSVPKEVATDSQANLKEWIREGKQPD